MRWPGQGALPGPLHDLVDIAVEVHVHRVGGARRERAAEQGREDQADRGNRAGGQEHRGHGDDQQQDDDARLRQREVGARGVAHRGGRLARRDLGQHLGVRRHPRAPRARPSPAPRRPSRSAPRARRARHAPRWRARSARWRRRRAPGARPGPGPPSRAGRAPGSAAASSAPGPCTTRTGPRRRSRAPGGRTSRRRRAATDPARCCRPSAAIPGRRDPLPRPGRRCRRATSRRSPPRSRRSAGDTLPAPVPAGDRVRAAMATANPSTRNATAKWIVTTPGSSWVAMIQPPIAACATNSGSRITAMIAAGRSTSRRRSSDQPPAIPSARVRLPARNASSRCVYSISVWYSARGIHEPKHCGQSGHPSPEPVARTTPPHAIRSRMATTVAVARARKVRFMGLRRTMIGGLPGAASGLGYWAPWLRPPPPPSPRSTASHPASTRSSSASSRSAAPRPPRSSRDRPEPIEEIERLVRAGGKRIRPAFCVWGYRAAGGPDVPAIWDAAAALELLHTMALIHDDVMDDDEQRRGEPTVHARQTAAAARRGLARPRAGRRRDRDPHRRPGGRIRGPAARARRVPRRSTGRGGGAVPDDPAGARAGRLPRPGRRRGRGGHGRLSQRRRLHGRGAAAGGRCAGGRVAAARTRRCGATPGPWARRSSCSTISPTATRLPARHARTRRPWWREPGRRWGSPLAPEAVIALDQLAELVGSL